MWYTLHMMMVIVAVIVGGDGSIPVVVLGAALLASMQLLRSWQFGSDWQDANA